MIHNRNIGYTMATLSKNIRPKKKSNLVKIKNDLVEAFVKSNNLTALKILFFLAYDCDKKPDYLMSIKLDTKHLCEYCNIELSTLKRNIKQMQETSISWKDDEAEHFVSVIPKAKFGYNGVLEIDIYEDIMNMIVDVKNKYTTIDAEQLMKLSSKHSARMILLLEMINGFSDNVAKRKHYSLEDLNQLFGTDYKRFGLFEQKILKPVKQELDNSSKLSFIYSTVYDKDKKTVGRSSAVGVIIDLVVNKTLQPKLF